MQNFFQRTPFFRLLVPLILGIIAYQYLILPVWALFALFGLAFALIFSSFFVPRANLQYRFRWLFGSGVSVFLFAFAFVLCANTDRRNALEHLSQEGIFLVEVTRAPSERARSYLVEVKILQFSDSIQIVPSQGRAFIYLAKDSAVADLRHGDRLLVETEFNPPEGVRNPDGFDYARHLERRGIGATSFIPSGSWEKVGRNERFSIIGLAQHFQLYFLNVFRQFDFKREDFAVLGALTFGYTDELDSELRASHAAAGTVHLMAVSGLHVGIICAVFTFIFSFLGKTQRQRNLRTVIILLLLWMYAFITGLPPSVFRSTLMCTFVLVGGLFSKKSLSFNTIFMSAFFMLTVNPNLLFSIGFQLSYSAVLSIIYFLPRANKLVSFNNKYAKWVYDSLVISLVTQIATTPFSLYYFQIFPNYFLFSNLIAIPIATFIIYFAVTLLVVSWIPILSVVVAFLLHLLLRALNLSAVFFENLPYSVFIISLNEIQVLLLILLIFALCYYFFSRKYYALVVAFCCVIGFFGNNAQIKHNTLNTQKLIVYSGNRHTHISFIDGRQNLIYTSDYTELHRLASSFWNNRKLKNPIEINKTNYFMDGFSFGFSSVVFNGLRILILEEDFSHTYTTEEPIKVDYLIIGNGLRPRIERLLECIEPKKIITDRTITVWFTNQIREVAKERSIGFHSTRLDGAYVRKWR